jgi:hypothetical protein
VTADATLPVERILLSTVVYREPADIFPYLRSFETYPRYADHLEEVVRVDGGDTTADTTDDRPQYDLRLRWWKLSYTAHSTVVDVTEPTLLEWELREDIDARGAWRIDPEPAAAPSTADTASRVYFDARYDPHSADKNAISLPTFVSFEWVLAKLQPKLVAEAETIVERLVADIEGERRDVSLTLHESPRSEP